MFLQAESDFRWGEKKIEEILVWVLAVLLGMRSDLFGTVGVAFSSPIVMVLTIVKAEPSCSGKIRLESFS